MATDAKPSSSKPKIDSSASSKKVVEKSIKTSISVENKSRSTTHESKTVKTVTSQSKGKKTVSRTREKKVFSLPGQKFEVPEEREPLRIFYESLSKQIPSSEMAEFWLMEHGLLPPERAKKAFEKKQRKQKLIRSGTPIKPPAVSGKQVSSKPESSKRPQTAPNNGEIKVKKRLTDQSNDDEEDDDDDFVLSHKRRKG